jgi:hypothetical protein
MVEIALALGLGVVIGTLCGLGLAAQNLRSYRGAGR